MDIGVQLVQLEKRLAAVERQSRLSSASLDDTSITVKDSVGLVRGMIGQQADGTTAVNIVNGGPPPVPSTPTAAPALGGIAAGWDGTFADGAFIPMDWARVEVHASTTAGFDPTPATLVATIETAQGGIVYVPATAPTYVRLLARNTSGAASAPTGTVGPYAPRPVAGEIGIGEITATLISDGAVTTPKLFANAVTTAKLDVGSVDATALKADAITGKVITGGEINGSVFQTSSVGAERITINEANANKIIIYDETGRAVGELSGRGLLLEGTNGALMYLDPDNTYPNLRLTNDDQSNEAVINVVENTPGSANLGMNSGKFSGSGFTDLKWRTFFGEDFWVAERIRQSANSTTVGGRIDLRADHGSVGYADTTGTTLSADIIFTAGIANIRTGRLVATPAATSSSATWISGAAGQTGPLFRITLDSVDKLVVFPSGNLQSFGTVFAPALETDSLSVSATTFTAYTPTLTGGGSATFSTRDGWYYKLGDMVFVYAYIVIGTTAGTGTTGIMVSLPSVPWRGSSADRRQAISGYGGGIGAGTNSGIGGNITGLVLGSGTGAVLDHIRTPTDIQLRGNNLAAGAIITLEGWYREA